MSLSAQQVASDDVDVLLLPECDAITQGLESTSIEEFGSTRWAGQHQNMEKLNMQAIINAQSHADPFVKEALVLSDKMEVLVEQLLAIELWKEKVFPPLVDKKGFAPNQTFPIVMVLHHEATVVNLLETLLFYRDTCECCGESVLDLIDYCYRKITSLVARHEGGELVKLFGAAQTGKAIAERSSVDEVKLQDEKTQFDIATKCLSILRYLIEYRHALPMSALTRLLNVHDVPCLMVQLVEQSPWQQRDGSSVRKYTQGGKWETVATADIFKLTKVEAQPWISLHHLVMDSECQRRYNFSHHNSNVLLRLRAYMPEVLMDQLPFLVDLKMFLERLALTDQPMQPSAANSSFVIEQMPEIRQRLIERYAGKWVQIAESQRHQYFNPDPDEMKRMADRWCETYDFKSLDRLAVTEKPKCALCGSEATKRCSKCQMEWYCRRECQVKHWKKHKDVCVLMSQTSAT